MLAASIGLSAFSAGADMQLTSKTPPSFDKSAFEESAHQALKGKVMGYSFLIMKDGKLVAEGAGGKARNRADGFKLMTTSTPQNLGSLFKFISGVTMLHILERPPAGSAGGQGSFASRLDAPVALLYPQIWQNAIETPAISDHHLPPVAAAQVRIPRLRRSDGLLQRSIRCQPDRQAQV